MTSNITGRRRLAGKWGVAVLTAAIAMVPGGSMLRASAAENWHAIEGVWLVQVQLRICATGAPLGPPFSSVVTFHPGGTISEGTANRAFAPGQRTDAQGVWETLGHGAYSQRMVSLIAFSTDPNLPTTPGFLEGWQVVEQTVESTDADHMTSSGTNAFYRTDGTVYRTGCSTAIGTRFK